MNQRMPSDRALGAVLLLVSVGYMGVAALPVIDWRVVFASALAFLVYVVVLERVGYLVATTVFVAVD